MLHGSRFHIPVSSVSPYSTMLNGFLACHYSAWQASRIPHTRMFWAHTYGPRPASTFIIESCGCCEHAYARMFICILYRIHWKYAFAMRYRIPHTYIYRTVVTSVNWFCDENDNINWLYLVYGQPFPHERRQRILTLQSMNPIHYYDIYTS